MVETAEIIAECTYPDLAGAWGHHGKHWVRLAELAAFAEREGASPVKKPVGAGFGMRGLVEGLERCVGGWITAVGGIKWNRFLKLVGVQGLFTC